MRRGGPRASEGAEHRGSIDDVREEAARRGCDAVVVVDGSDETIVNDRHGGIVSSAPLRGYQARCIVYKDGSPASPPVNSAPPSRAPTQAPPAPKTSTPIGENGSDGELRNKLASRLLRRSRASRRGGWPATGEGPSRTGGANLSRVADG